MPTASSYKKYEITNSGGTFTIDIDELYDSYIMYGTATLSSNVSVVASATPTYPARIKVYYNGNVTLGSNSITIFGKSINQEQAKTPLIIDAVYDLGSSGWVIVITDSATGSPPDYDSVETTTMPAGGGTKTLLPGKSKTWQQIVGSGTMSGNYSIVTSGDQPDGLTYYIKYAATFNHLGFAVTILGVSLSDQEIAAGNTMIIARYDAANLVWRTHKINGGGLNLGEEVYIIPVSFESGEQCQNKIYVPYPFEIIKITAAVTKALAGSNDGTITASIGGTPVTTGVVTIPQSAALNAVYDTTPTANASGTSGNSVEFTTLKTTAGGKALLSVHIKRLA